MRIPPRPVPIPNASMYPRSPARAWHPRVQAAALAHVYGRHGRLLGDVDLDNARRIIVANTTLTVAVFYAEQIQAGRPVMIILKLAATTVNAPFTVGAAFSQHNGSSDASTYQLQNVTPEPMGLATLGCSGEDATETSRHLGVVFGSPTGGGIGGFQGFGLGTTTNGDPNIIAFVATHSVTTRKVRIGVRVQSTSPAPAVVIGVTAYDADLVST